MHAHTLTTDNSMGGAIAAPPSRAANEARAVPSPVVTISSRGEPRLNAAEQAAENRRAAVRRVLGRVFAPVLGIALFVLLWQIIATHQRPAADAGQGVRRSEDRVRRSLLSEGAERPGHRLERAVVAQARGARLRPGGADRHPGWAS